MTTKETVGAPEAWREIEERPGVFVLMDAPTFRAVRVIVSATDRHILTETVRGAFPGDEVRAELIGGRLLLVRMPRG